MIRGVVAEFHKSAGKRLSLFSIVKLEMVKGHDGTEYLSRTGYDVEWSRRYDGYIWRESSGGGDRVIEVSGIYFISGDVQVKETPTQVVDFRDKPPWTSKRTQAIRKRNRTRRLAKLPKLFTVDPYHRPFSGDLIDWMEYYACDDDPVHCSVCRDWVRGEDPCDHVWWCNKSGWYSTPTERCKCKTREKCYGH